ASGNPLSDSCITLTANFLGSRTCSASYTRPMPPEPSTCVTRKVPASTSPSNGSCSGSGAASEVASLGQTRKSAGYLAPHTGHRRVLATAKVGASFDVTRGPYYFDGS